MNTKDDNFLIAEFMGFPKVTVGSSWDYNRHFDHASITRNLIVKEVDDIKNAEFEQKMPFTKYGLDAFDGIIFRPSGYPEYSLSKFHCPARPYATSWDWLMPVVEKIRTCGYSNEVSFGISDGYSQDGFPKWSVHISANITRWKKDGNGKEVWPNTSYKIKMETLWWHSEKELLPTVYKAVVEFIKWYRSQPEGGTVQ